MIEIKKYFTISACLFAFLMNGFKTKGQTSTITYVKTFDSSEITQGAVLPVTDTAYFNTSNNTVLTKPYPVKDIITLMFNEASLDYFVKDSATLIFKIIQTKYGSTSAGLLNSNGTNTNGTINNIIDSSQIDTLTVTYDTTGGNIYRARNSIVFYGAYDLKIELLSNPTPAQTRASQGALVLQAQLITTPDYNFANDNPNINYISFDTTNNASTGEIKANWANQIGADAYDLEWAYVDSGSVSSINMLDSTTVNASIFTNNATRVTVTNSQYSIPLIESYSGILFARVRSVQFAPGGGKIVSSWSTDNLTKQNKSGATGLAQYSFIGHQQNLNWQSTTSFAEQGKRKVVVQYYDGSLRGRQVVTKDNTTNTTIVGETLYDYQGRPAIQVLPSPTLNTIIQYSSLFNVAGHQSQGLNNGGRIVGTVQPLITYDEYAKDLYDSIITPATYCGSAAPPMDSIIGASGYYSQLNPTLGLNAPPRQYLFIPDAQGYPFTQTRYTQDNTGRISSQGGVGPMFQLNSGHETNYFYGGFPAQQEIDALFGTEVGVNSHYFKNMVQDANGQFSVSYVDMHGRTIATALAGQPPSNTNALNSYNINTITETIADSATNNTEGMMMQSVKSLLVSSPGIYNFNYTLGAQSITAPSCNSQPLCYDCLYDLEIKITSDCDNQKLPGNVPFDTIIHNFSLSNIDTNCNPQGFDVSFSETLPTGNYEITKSLTLDQAGENYYRDSIYSKHNTCISQDSMINYFKSLQSDTACIANTLADSGSYYSLRQAMLADMTPTSGQYAQTSGTGDPYSIFYISTTDKDSIYPYQQSSITLTYISTGTSFVQPLVYFDANGNPDTVIDDYTGARVIPQQLDTAQFVEKFKPSWANTLLYLHPEYMKLYADSINDYASSLWDVQFTATNTFEQAKRLGYLDPIGNTSVHLLAQYYVTGATYDPVSTTGFNNQMEDSLANYQPRLSSSAGYAAGSLYAIASSTIECIGVGQLATPDAPSSTACPVPDSNVFDTTVMCQGDLDMAWRAFRSLYLQIQQNVIGPPSLASPPNSISSSTLIAAGHIPNFMSTNDAFNQGGLGNVNVNAANTSVQQATAQDSAASFYCSTCAAYAQLWMQQLSGCTEYPPDSIKNVIIPELEEVCVKGSDLEHPFGSRSISPDSSYKYGNFDSVIAAYNETHGDVLTTACNADLLTNPQAYNNQPGYTNVPVYSQPDSCECGRITQLNTEYSFNKLTGETFSAYLLRVYGTQIPDSSLTVLLNSCNTPTPTCHYFTQPIMLPPALQCNTGNICINCTQMQSAYSSFIAKYGNVTLTIGDALDTTQRKINQLFADYMNNQFGFTKQSYEYMEFMQQCSNFTVPAAICVGCDSLQSLELAYFDSITPSLGSQNAMLIYIQNHLLINGLQASITQIQEALSSCNLNYDQNISFQGIGLFSKGLGNLNIGANGNDFSIEFWAKFPGSHGTFPILYFNDEKNSSYIGSSSLFKGFYIWADSLNSKEYLYADIGDSSSSLLSFHSTDTLSPSTWYHVVITRSGNNVSGFQIYLNGNQSQNVNVNGQTTLTNGDITPIYRIVSQASEGNYGSYVDSGLLIGSNSFSGGPGPTIQMKNLRFYSRVLPSNEIIANCSNYEGYPTDTDSLRLWSKMNQLFGLPLDYSQYNTPSMYFQTVTGEGNNLGDTLSTSNFWTSTAGISESNSCLPHTPNILCYYPYVPNTPTLCGKAAPIFSIITADSINSQCNNCTDSTEFAVSDGVARWYSYRDSILNRFDSLYYTKCLQAYRYESFTVTHPESEYQFTLYYYDQAGNLIKTVPPQGVHPIWRTSWLDSVDIARAAGNVILPNDSLLTTYCYNSLNQVTAQQTPDGGISQSYYDRLGRLTLSQNAKQAVTGNYSYTLYDLLGRLIEVGQLTGKGMTTQMARTVSSLSTWMNSRWPSATQITHTYYDSPYEGFIGTGINAPIGQRNLRSRVSWVGLYDSAADVSSMVEYTNATFYTYDVHGNVDTLLQDYGNSQYKPNSMNSTATGNPSGNRWKKITYTFDLISGKVNSVGYQVGQPDQFYHLYQYDAENRLTNVLSSADSINWDNDASYSYYAHGPLSRTVLGQQSVQGVDYAYTLQGWLKGVNSTAPWNNDMNRDGWGKNALTVARDAFGFGLYYWGDQDFIPISNQNPFAVNNTAGEALMKGMWNGNISAMSIYGNSMGKPIEYMYVYDQLNRLISNQAYKGLDTTKNVWNVVAINNYKENFNYDANGNILSLNRYSATAIMDSLSYNYNVNTNQLNYIKDKVTNDARQNLGDIQNQSTNNYTYDQIGDLISDAMENVSNITWNVYGKIQSVTTGSTTITYTYDAMGNRISETANGITTWYVRDATGNIMSNYVVNTEALNSSSGLTNASPSNINNAQDLIQTEIPIYGSSRLGVFKSNTDVSLSQFISPYTKVSFYRGEKFYELDDHRGNVYVVVNDKKIPLSAVTTSKLPQISYFMPQVVSANDYYSFGMIEPGRNYSSASTYRYGMNGQEKSLEIDTFGNLNTAQFWEYDARLGRRWNLDPKSNESWSSYSAFSNNPLTNRDILGDTSEFTIYYNPKSNETDGQTQYYTGKYYNGQLHDEDGKVVDLNGVDKNLNASSLRIINSFNQIRNQSEVGKWIIDKITGDKTKTTFDIDLSTNGRTQTGENFIDFAYNQSDLIPTTKGTEAVSKNYNATIVHELAHLYGHLFNTSLSTVPWVKLQTGEDENGSPIFKTISKDEIIAVSIENVYRSQVNLPTRTHYSTDTEGNAVNDTRIINSNKDDVWKLYFFNKIMQGYINRNQTDPVQP